MENYAVVFLASVKNGSACCEIHKAECRDLSKKDNHHNVRALSPASIIQEELKGEMGEIGYTEKDFKVMDCAK